MNKETIFRASYCPSFLSDVENGNGTIDLSAKQFYKSAARIMEYGVLLNTTYDDKTKKPGRIIERCYLFNEGFAKVFESKGDLGIDAGPRKIEITGDDLKGLVALVLMAELPVPKWIYLIPD